MKFETPELPLAAALQTLGFSPDIVKAQDGKYLFVFDKTSELDSSVARYWSNDLKISPKLQWNNVRELKSRMAAYQIDSQGGTQK